MIKMSQADITAQFRQISEAYVKDVKEIMNETLVSVGENAKFFIESIGGYENRRKRTSYRKKFFLLNVDSGISSYVRLANKQWQLTHLLEDGHDIKNKKGTLLGRASAFPHWTETEKRAVDEFERRLLENLRG